MKCDISFTKSCKLGCLLSISFLIVLLSSFQTASACVNPDTLPNTIVNYDSALTQIEIRVTNLRLMTENPNTFCSCAISSWSSVFTTLLYVAFVDSGTNQPYPNFDPWEANTGASTSWDASTTGFPSWDGFIAEVINSGLSPTNAVDLLVRAELPPGYTVSFLDSSISSVYIGTDEWDPVNQTLTNSHQGLHWLASTGYSLNEQELSYFNELDKDIEEYYANLPNSIDPQILFPGLKIGPNPAQDVLSLEYQLSSREILGMDIFDPQGRVFVPVYREELWGQKREFLIDLSSLELSGGLYILRLYTDEIQVGLKFIKQ